MFNFLLGWCVGSVLSGGDTYIVQQTPNVGPYTPPYPNMNKPRRKKDKKPEKLGGQSFYYDEDNWYIEFS